MMALLSLSQSSFSAAVCGLSLLHRLYVAVFGGGGSFASARKEEEHVRGIREEQGLSW